MAFASRYIAQQNVLLQKNPKTMGVMKLLKYYYPALAKKVMEGNPLILKMAENNMVSMDILNYPICGKCEALAAFCDYARDNRQRPIVKPDGMPMGVCRCLKCSAVTVDPITFLDWCVMELRKKAPDTIAEDLLGASDAVAEKMLQDATRFLKKTIKEKRV